MKAAVLFELNAPLRLVDDLQPRPLKRGQVLVRLAYSGVCHSQLMEARGKRGEDRWLPHLLGHEGSGEVVEIGPEVTKVKVGDHVVLGWIKGKGIEAGGAQYDLGDITVNAGGVTTFNELAVVSENRLTHIPENIPMDQAVLLGCAAPTGMGILTNSLQPKPGSTIGVMGLGGIGLSALMASVLFDPVRLVAFDVNPDKLALAKEIGATDIVNVREQDPVEFVREITDGKGLDYSIEAAGMTRTIEQAFDCVRNGGGHCVFASHPPEGEKIQLDPHALISGKRISGTWGGGCDPDRDLPRFAQLVQERNLPLHKLLDKTYPLEEVNQALDDLEQRRVTRPLLVMPSEEQT